MTSTKTGFNRSIELCDGLDDLETVRSFCKELIEASVDKPEVAEDLIGRLQLAATEAIVNVIKHGYAGATEKPIECRGRSTESELSLDIMHKGSAFVPETIPKIEEPQENGMGLFLMEQCADEVIYSQTADGRQCVTLLIQTN